MDMWISISFFFFSSERKEREGGVASPALHAEEEIRFQVIKEEMIRKVFQTKGARSLFQTRGKATLPDLSYDYGALEPVISAEIMQLHHSKHHNTYVTNLNVAMDKLAECEKKGDTSGVIATQQAIKFNGGGHVNHSIFWKNLAPIGKGGGEMPEEETGRGGCVDQM